MKADAYIRKLKKKISACIKSKKYEDALVLAKTLSHILYDYNQTYTDVELESNLLTIRDAILTKEEYHSKRECVLFYDGFGLDLRGWAASYVRALTSLGHQLVYVCPSDKKDKIPNILGEMDPTNSIVIYLETSSSCISKTKEIDGIFKKYKPGTAFFYTTPWDVEAAVAFSNNSATTRIQVDLTDHAYWIGVNTFDYITESREMGASIAKYQRGISEKKIIKLDVAPYINREICEEPLPFDIYRERYIFTGGALYKTLGDSKLLYYRAIRHVLSCYYDVFFLYAGGGDDTEIKKLSLEFPNRVFLIPERPDYFRIIENCLVYINSYPMFGGLMMRYAALAGKVPITLKHNNDSDGLLINQEALGIEFDTYDDYITEIDRLLSDDAYRQSKGDSLRGSVYDEEMFVSELRLIINEHKSKARFDVISEYDTTEFRNEYNRRYKLEDLYKIIASKSNISLLKYFPKEFVLGTIIKIKEKLK